MTFAQPHGVGCFSTTASCPLEKWSGPLSKTYIELTNSVKFTRNRCSTHAGGWCLGSKMGLLHLKTLKKLKSAWQKWNSSIKYEPNLTQREWGAPAPSFSHSSYCDSLKWGHLSPGISFCVRQPDERDMKRNKNGIFTFFFFSNQACLCACKRTGSIGRFMPRHDK